MLNFPVKGMNEPLMKFILLVWRETSELQRAERITLQISEQGSTPALLQRGHKEN